MNRTIGTACAGTAAALALGSAGAAAERAPKPAIVVGFERAVYHFPTPEKIAISGSLRSQIDRRWSLVTGRYGRRGLWAAWVRRSSAGRYRVQVFRTRTFHPGAKPPCDIKPAFSEPEC
jgi:hypothetical protein